MDDVDRIVARDYEPSDQDVVKARLRTVGVQEYHLSIPGGEHSISDTGMPPCLTTHQVLCTTTGSCMMLVARGHLYVIAFCFPASVDLTRVTWTGNSEAVGHPTLTISILSFF